MGYFMDNEMGTSGEKNPGMDVTAVSGTGFDAVCKKYRDEGKKGYIVTTTLTLDDDTDQEYSFLFFEPKTASYDRYAKTASTSNSKASKAFALDNICPEQKEELRTMLNDYPAMGISLAEKLLYMLGLSKTTSVKKL